MFIGHFAVGYAAKRAAPRLSLALLFAAAQLPDLLWPVLVALGVERVRIDPGNTVVTPLDFISYPWSHSLLALIVWGAIFGVLARALSHDRRAFFVVAALVVSHWVLDFLTHRPDMPLYPGGPKEGLGLWNSTWGTVLVEVSMYLVGLWIYLQATRARDATGRWASGALALVLLVIYGANLAGPAPPSVTAIWMAGMAGGVLFCAWAWWSDRHRQAV